MPGKPVLRNLNKIVQAAGGDHVLFDLVAEGRSVGSIMAEYDLHRTMFYQWIYSGGDERAAAYAEAKRISAEKHVEDAGAILDGTEHGNTPEPVFSPADVALRKARAHFRQWLAAHRDPETYGERKVDMEVNVSIGSLHLDALRQHGKMSDVEPVNADFEIEGGDESEDGVVKPEAREEKATKPS